MTELGETEEHGGHGGPELQRTGKWVCVYVSEGWVASLWSLRSVQSVALDSHFSNVCVQTARQQVFVAPSLNRFFFYFFFSPKASDQLLLLLHMMVDLKLFEWFLFFKLYFIDWSVHIVYVTCCLATCLIHTFTDTIHYFSLLWCPHMGAFLNKTTEQMERFIFALIH